MKNETTKAVIGRYYSKLNDACNEADRMGKLWNRKRTFVVIGNDQKGYLVVPKKAII